jgi:hypothetical protein
MVMIEQHGHNLTLRRGEQVIVLPAASVAQRLAAALAQLGVTATRPQTNGTPRYQEEHPDDREHP